MDDTSVNSELNIEPVISNSDCTINPDSNESGRTIVELGHLVDQLRSCVDCGQQLNMVNTKVEKLYGFGSVLSVECQCGLLNRIETSKRHCTTGSRGPPIFDVNSKAALVSRHHCRSTTTRLNKMKIRLVPALEDNYMYLLIDETTGKCAAVDPVEPDKILSAVSEEQLTDERVKLSCVLTTHHHWDHAGGNKEFIAKTEKMPVYGGDDRIDELTQKVVHDTEFKVGNLNIKCLFTPCHTSGHICYYVTGDSAEPAVFTGDTLFSGGCGRFFEGTADQMYKALIETLSELPGNTRVFCGHEYTVANLKYAIHTEPDNIDIQNKIKWATKQRDNGLPTIPTTIDDEKKINPFMRVRNSSVQEHAGCKDPIKVMASLRKEKDTFKPK